MTLGHLCCAKCIHKLDIILQKYFYKFFIFVTVVTIACASDFSYSEEQEGDNKRAIIVFTGDQQSTIPRALLDEFVARAQQNGCNILKFANLLFPENMAYAFAGKRQDSILYKIEYDNGNISSRVTNMKGLFCNAINFNGNINSWDVSNVKNMSDMFTRAKNFNQPLNNWDVSNVENMYCMFCYAESFNQIACSNLF